MEIDLKRLFPLTEAQGYFDLELYEDAWLAIEDLTSEERNTRPVHELRMKILLATEQWEPCQQLAAELVRSSPSWPVPYLLGAEAMDRQGFAGDAVEFLLVGEKFMPNDPQFLFQWASYEVKLGAPETAKRLIGKLIDIDSTWRSKVLEYPGFEAIWDSLAG